MSITDSHSHDTDLLTFKCLSVSESLRGHVLQYNGVSVCAYHVGGHISV